LIHKLTKATHQGQRAYQEDRSFSFKIQGGTCFGVFDGHGSAACAHLCSQRFPIIFRKLLKTGIPIPEVLTQGINILNLETQFLNSGSTASVVFIPLPANEVHVAVLGDSPVLVRQADKSLWVAPEHNVRTNWQEADAARARGGFVQGGYLYMSYDGQGLQMARALGDTELSRVLSRIPDVSTRPLGAGSWVFVGTDGALDPSHANEAEGIKAIVALIEAGSEASAIVQRALDIPTGDNVTAMLLRIG
jgi:serine/threonine protein phosphatase PrpC